MVLLVVFFATGNKKGAIWLKSKRIRGSGNGNDMRRHGPASRRLTLRATAHFCRSTSWTGYRPIAESAKREHHHGPGETRGHFILFFTSLAFSIYALRCIV